MEEITKLAKEIRRLSETSDPVIYGLSEKLIHLLETSEIYTKEELIKIIERTDNDIPDYDQDRD